MHKQNVSATLPFRHQLTYPIFSGNVVSVRLNDKLAMRTFDTRIEISNKPQILGIPENTNIMRAGVFGHHFHKHFVTAVGTMIIRKHYFEVGVILR